MVWNEIIVDEKGNKFLVKELIVKSHQMQHEAFFACIDLQTHKYKHIPKSKILDYTFKVGGDD